MIIYNNLFFKTGNPTSIKNFDYWKRFGTLYDLIDLLNEQISTLKAAKEHEKMKENIKELGDFVLLEKGSIKKNKIEGNIKSAKQNTGKSNS